MVVSLFQDSKGSMISIAICLLFSYLLYIGSYIPHIFVQSPKTKRMKQFSNDISHKYVYGILIMMLSIVLFPHPFMAVMSFVCIISMIASLFGNITQILYVTIISNGMFVLSSTIMALALLSTSWIP